MRVRPAQVRRLEVVTAASRLTCVEFEKIHGLCHGLDRIRVHGPKPGGSDPQRAERDEGRQVPVVPRAARLFYHDKGQMAGNQEARGKEAQLCPGASEAQSVATALGQVIESESVPACRRQQEEAERRLGRSQQQSEPYSLAVKFKCGSREENQA